MTLTVCVCVGGVVFSPNFVKYWFVFFSLALISLSDDNFDICGISCKYVVFLSLKICRGLTCLKIRVRHNMTCY